MDDLHCPSFVVVLAESIQRILKKNITIPLVIKLLTKVTE